MPDRINARPMYVIKYMCTNQNKYIILMKKIELQDYSMVYSAIALTLFTMILKYFVCDFILTINTYWCQLNLLSILVILVILFTEYAIRDHFILSHDVYIHQTPRILFIGRV